MMTTSLPASETTVTIESTTTPKDMKDITMKAKWRLIQFIHDPEHRAIRKRVAIKSRLLFDYLRRPMSPAGPFEDWTEIFTEICRSSHLSDCPSVFRDNEGDLVIIQPRAETLLLAEAWHFGGAVGLILMAETCYGTSIGSPDLFIPALERFRPLVMDGQLPSAALLHQFLEVDEAPGKWIIRKFGEFQMIPDVDYLYLPDDDTVTPPSCREDGASAIRLSPVMAAKVAASTPTLRGRKMKACLVEPGIEPFDLMVNDLALLDLLFTPPARGLASL